MTLLSIEEPILCEWCASPVPPNEGPGRPRRYCRRSHRQRAYEARRLAERRSLGPDEVLVSQTSWEALQRALEALQAASRETAARLGTIESGEASDAAAVAEYLEAVGGLTAAVAELTAIHVEPMGRW